MSGQFNQLDTLIAKKIFNTDIVNSPPPSFSSDLTQACEVIDLVIKEYQKMAFLRIQSDKSFLEVKICYNTGSPIFQVRVPIDTSLSEALCRCALGAKR